MELKFNDANFESEVLKSDKPVLVDFFAEWCGPCKALAPIIEEIANEKADIKVGKLNVDESPETAKKYKVMSIPFIAYFKNGEIVSKLVGAHDKDTVLDMIK